MTKPPNSGGPPLDAGSEPRALANASSQEIEEWLAEGTHAAEMQALFGPEQYEELRALSEKARAVKRSAKARPFVVLLPGILGSMIGRRRSFPWRDQIIWLNLLGLPFGSLRGIALPAGKGLEVLDVFASYYAPLKLHLESRGFEVAYFPFDWRVPIEEAGKELAGFLAGHQGKGSVRLVGHSMGGLVIRAAWPHIARLGPGLKVERVVTLGSPYGGSSSPIRALRGNHETSRLLARISPGTSEEHAREIFSTFPGLAEMIFNPSLTGNHDFFDAAEWPDAGPRPNAAFLKNASKLQAGLPMPDCPYHLIIGVDVPTITNARVENGGIEYHLSRDGDGTVPRASALIEGVASCHYVRDQRNTRGLGIFRKGNEAAHGSLCKQPRINKAVAELLLAGETALLDSTAGTSPYNQRWESESKLASGVPARLAELRGLPPGTIEEQTAVLDELLDFGVDAPGEVVAAGPSLAQITLTRGRKGRLEISLAHGDIASADTCAIAFGVLQEVDPHSALRAVDRILDGALDEVLQRRLFQPYPGSLFMLPTGRHPIAAEFVVLVGLGTVDGLNLDTLELAAANLAHTLIRTKIEDVATILMGSSAGEIEQRLRSVLKGFLRGFKEAGEPRSFRRLMLCEQSREGFDRLKECLASLSFQNLFGDIEVSFEEIQLPVKEAPEPARATAAQLSRMVRPAYLQMETEREGSANHPWQVRGLLLLPDSPAAVSPWRHSFLHRDATNLLERIPVRPDDPPWTKATLEKFGRELAMLLFPEEARNALTRLGATPLIVIHDAPLARLPWETLAPGGSPPALQGGVSRRYLLDIVSAGRWPDRTRETDLRLLLVVDPTEDLRGAREEGQFVQGLFNRMPGVKLDVLWGRAATWPELERILRMNPYDVIHYAGHAQFVAGRPELSGLVCADERIFSARDMDVLPRTPALIVLNACESARTRKASAEALHLRQNHPAASLAHGFLRSGVANLIGTYWPVGDAAAKIFAQNFYTRLLAGETAGTAIVETRQMLHQRRDCDWANYIHFGNAGFALR